jgi:hypothetical protein
MEFFNNIIDAIFLGDFMKVWVPVFATLMMMSYLYKDNPLFKVGEQIFLGVSIGYSWVFSWIYIIKPYLIRPVADMTVDFHTSDFTIIFWLLLSSTMLFRFSRKKSWIANYYFAFVFGYISGLVIPMTVQGVMVQTSNLMKNLNQGSFFETTKWMVIIFGTFASLMYFFFSSPHKGALGKTAKGGIFIMMIFFGAAFGSTVMGRVALFIDRALLLVDNPIPSIISFLVIAIFLFVYFKFIHKEKEFDDSTI